MLSAAGSLLSTAANEKANAAVGGSKPVAYGGQLGPPPPPPLAAAAGGRQQQQQRQQLGEEDVKPVLDLAVEQLRRDIHNTSQMLSISRGSLI